MIVYYHNHYRDGLPIEDAVQEASESCKHCFSNEEKDYPVAHIMVIHDPDTKDKALERRLIIPIRKKCVIIFASSEGLKFAPSRQRYGNDNVNFDYYVFGIKKRYRENVFLADKDWEALLSWAGQITESDKEIDTIIQEMPIRVRHLLVQPDRSYTRALYILCEGYIAAHGGKVAAVHMEGWDKLPHELQTTAQAKRDCTERTNWWTDVLGTGWSQDVKRELVAFGEDASWLDEVDLDAKVIDDKTVCRIWTECRGILKRHS